MKSKDKLFTIILTNYNNDDYIYEAIDSVLQQDYKKIELIITDDCSKQFNKNKIIKYIDKNKKSNILNIRFIINNKNLGTVKTLNKAIRLATGDYILFFASDDKLANEKVISNYIKLFKNKKYNIITSNWILCDIDLNRIKNYNSVVYLKSLNFLSIKNIYAKMCCSNLFGSGATCYRKEVFSKYILDEKYILLEDWPFWLSLLKNSERIYYGNFDGLLHRAGGTSENAEITTTKKQFFKEMLQTFNLEILPNISNFRLNAKFKIIRSYYLHIKYYKEYIDVSNEYKIFNNLFNNKIIKVLWLLDKINPKIFEKIKILNKYNKVVPITFGLTLIINFLALNIFKVNKYILVLLITLTYLIIYYLLSVFIKYIDLRRK